MKMNASSAFFRLSWSEIFHSDHGEMLGDHGLIYKGSRFFEGLVHVPLIFSWPGKIKKDVVSSALVELVDLAPTILEAAGIDRPYYMQGQSLFSKMCNGTDIDKHKKIVVSEFFHYSTVTDFAKFLGLSMS